MKDKMKSVLQIINDGKKKWKDNKKDDLKEIYIKREFEREVQNDSSKLLKYKIRCEKIMDCKDLESIAVILVAMMNIVGMRDRIGLFLLAIIIEFVIYFWHKKYSECVLILNEIKISSGNETPENI